MSFPDLNDPRSVLASVNQSYQEKQPPDKKDIYYLRALLESEVKRGESIKNEREAIEVAKEAQQLANKSLDMLERERKSAKGMGIGAGVGFVAAQVLPGGPIVGAAAVAIGAGIGGAVPLIKKN